MRLGRGDCLEVESEGEQITLRPDRGKVLLKIEYGVCVYQGEAIRASIAEVIEQEGAKHVRDLTE